CECADVVDEKLGSPTQRSVPDGDDCDVQSSVGELNRQDLERWTLVCQQHPKAWNYAEVMAARQHFATQIGGSRSNRDVRRRNARTMKGVHRERAKIVLTRLQGPWVIQQLCNFNLAAACQRIARSCYHDQGILEKHFNRVLFRR